VIVSATPALNVDLRWLSGASRSTAASFSPSLSNGQILPDGAATGWTAIGSRRDADERPVIEAALERAKGRVAEPFGAAEKLGMPPSTLESKTKALHIDKRRFKPVTPSSSHEVLSRGFREAS